MKVSIQTDLHYGRFSVDADYTETIENVLVKCSLVITEASMQDMTLKRNATTLRNQDRLDTIGYQEGEILFLRISNSEHKGCCCVLL